MIACTDMWYFARICAHARSWRGFAKCRFAHFPSCVSSMLTHMIHVREWEKLEILSARFRNHLHFTLHCKHRNLTPISLRVKTCVKGEAANNIIHGTQRALLNVRIKEISLPSDMHTEVTNWVKHAHKAEWAKCRRGSKTSVPG